MLKRHKKNTNLQLHYDFTFEGLPLIPGKVPYVYQYLERIKTVVDKALIDHPRTFAVRFDLKTPSNYEEFDTSRDMTRFFDSLKAHIKAYQLRAVREEKRIHETAVRYVWAREFSKEKKTHYHVLLLLNRDAFYTLGDFERESGLHWLIRSAWASVLDMRVDVLREAGLIHFCKNGSYHLKVNDIANFEATYRSLFRRASYLAKSDTKTYGDGKHSFDCSRI